jgi:hypothetical protein
MQRVSAGYTILEVMIFLAVSAALLGASMNLVSGKQSQVQFDQSVRDTVSKLQDWINDVPTGFTGGDPGQLNCRIQGNTPRIDTGGPSAAPECIFVGKAVQFTDKSVSDTQSGFLYAYSVFGRRLDSSTNQLTANLVDANPMPAVGQANAGNADLTETFSLGSAQVKSVTSSAIIPTTPAVTPSGFTDSHLIGFFSSFNTDTNSSQNGNEDLNVFQFDFNNSDVQTPGNQPGGSGIRNCLQLIAASCKIPNWVGNSSWWPERVKTFIVCLTDNKHTAQISITSSNGFNATVRSDYVNC